MARLSTVTTQQVIASWARRAAGRRASLPAGDSRRKSYKVCLRSRAGFSRNDTRRFSNLVRRSKCPIVVDAPTQWHWCRFRNTRVEPGSKSPKLPPHRHQLRITKCNKTAGAIALPNSACDGVANLLRIEILSLYSHPRYEIQWRCASSLAPLGKNISTTCPLEPKNLSSWFSLHGENLLYGFGPPILGKAKSPCFSLFARLQEHNQKSLEQILLTRVDFIRDVIK
jgi:hypothetical protein